MSIRWLRLVYFENIFDTEWNSLAGSSVQQKSKFWRTQVSSSFSWQPSLWRKFVTSRYDLFVRMMLIDVDCVKLFFDSLILKEAVTTSRAPLCPRLTLWPRSRHRWLDWSYKEIDWLIDWFTSQVTWLLFLIAGHITRFAFLVIDTRNEKSISSVKPSDCIFGFFYKMNFIRKKSAIW